MKKLLVVSVFAICFGTNAQSVSEINRFLGIPDTMSIRELRIYKEYQTTTSIELFRIFEDTNGIMKAIVYDLKGNQKIEERNLSSKNDMDRIWLEFAILNIDKLTDIEKISHKLENPRIVYDEKAGYLIRKTKQALTDGIAYTAKFKNYTEIGDFRFNNYQVFFEQFPEVDELNSYDKILKIISSNFGIWKK